MKKITSIFVVICMMFSAITCVHAYDGAKTQLQQIDKRYSTSTWAKSTNDTLDISWGEDPTRNVLKGEFMFAVLRAIQSCMLRLSDYGTFSSWTSLDFEDKNTLTLSAQEEASLLVQDRILTGYKNKMQLGNTLKRSEAAKILSCFNSTLKLEKVRNAPKFNDISGHWAEEYINDAYMLGMINGKSDTKFDPDGSMTLEQTMQTIYNLVGKTTIGYEKLSMEYIDVAYAMYETFKVVFNDTSYKTPRNARKYPYIDESIPSDIYEIENRVMYSAEVDETPFPKKTYELFSDSYDNLIQAANSYLDIILNIDYETISEDSLLESLQPYMKWQPDVWPTQEIEAFKEYVKNVKENHIKIKGYATPCLPIVFTGTYDFWIRYKITFEVVSSDTNKNLLLWSEGKTFDGKSFEMYVDVELFATNCALSAIYWGDSEKPKDGIYFAFSSYEQVKDNPNIRETTE